MHESLRVGDDPSVGGVKKDEGKLRWSLLPWDAVEEVVKVLMFGANKYTFRFDNKWQALFRVSNASKLRLQLGMDFAVTATKNSFEVETQNMQNDNSKIGGNGQNGTKAELKNWLDFETLILSKEQETTKPKELISYDLSDSLKNQISPMVVPSAEANNICTLTMTIPRDCSEESFVVNTTTVSGSWETMWQGLKKRSLISSGVDHREVQGNRNWEKGMEYGRLFDADLRHKIDWWQKGEAVAEDSRLHHLAHAACDTLFLLAYELRNKGKDDRPDVNKVQEK